MIAASSASCAVSMSLPTVELPEPTALPIRLSVVFNAFASACALGSTAITSSSTGTTSSSSFWVPAAT